MMLLTLPTGHAEGEFFQRLRPEFCARSHPQSPAVVFRAVLGIHLRQSARTLRHWRAWPSTSSAKFFFAQARPRGILMAGNHDHSQFNLLLGRKFVRDVSCSTLRSSWAKQWSSSLRSCCASLPQMIFFHLLLFELPQRVSSALRAFLTKVLRSPPKRFLNDLIYSLIPRCDQGFSKAFFFEMAWNHEPPIDQIFY